MLLTQSVEFIIGREKFAKIRTPLFSIKDARDEDCASLSSAHSVTEGVCAEVLSGSEKALFPGCNMML